MILKTIIITTLALFVTYIAYMYGIFKSSTMFAHLVLESKDLEELKRKIEEGARRHD